MFEADTRCHGLSTHRPEYQFKDVEKLKRIDDVLCVAASLFLHFGPARAL
jgi:hypothetical protein